MQKNPKKMFVIFLCILLFIFNTGCSKLFDDSQENSNEEANNQKKDPPEVLLSMEEAVENTIEQIQTVKDQKVDMARQMEIQQITQEKEEHGQIEEEKESQNKEEKQQENSQQNNESLDQNTIQQDGEEKREEEQQQGEEEIQEEQKEPKVDWTSIEKAVENLHANWNSYEVQAQKDGAPQDLRDNDELQLDTLTNWVMSHNEDETIKAANELYQYYPKFLNLYNHQAPPEIKEIIYYVRQIIIDAQTNTWDESNKRLEAINKAWQTAKARMEKSDQELNQKVEAAIEDFYRVVKQQNYLLVKLKGNILLKNLKEIK